MSGMLMSALGETMFMVLASTLFSALGGCALAVPMILAGPSGLRPNAKLYAVLDISVNLLRSFPFMILMIALIPFTRLVAGVAYGSAPAVVPLTIAAVPFTARLVEGSLLEVDPGVVEAARAFGASDARIIFSVMFPEALPSVVLNIAVLAVNLLGCSAMAGAVGGGGLGALAYNEGYIRFKADVMLGAVAVLIVIVQCIQSGGNYLYGKLR
jgi:D-methionine transport system permease protein